MVFSLTGILFKIFFVGGLVTSGPISTILSAASTGKTIYDQAVLTESNPTLAERGRALLPFTVAPLPKPASPAHPHP